MNDLSFSECKFNPNMVPYLYGEMSGRERSAFESHLVACTLCTDEFASISNARYEVYDWKKLEFDPLETPRFEIPSEEFAAEGSVFGWVEKLRAGFATGWLVPSAALAALAIVSVFAALLISLPDNRQDIAAKNDNSNIAAVGSSTVTPATSDPETAANSEDEIQDVINNEIRVDAADRQPKRLRSSAPGHPRPRNPVVNAKLTQLHTSEAKQATTRNLEKSVPRLNEFADDEDTSLRLAELFENIEARK
ncbi:MAG: zf-HC2 domain-containing protein [Acidobacteriota bacterium]